MVKCQSYRPVEQGHPELPFLVLSHPGLEGPRDGPTIYLLGIQDSYTIKAMQYTNVMLGSVGDLTDSNTAEHMYL